MNMAPGDIWYRCVVTPGMHCRGLHQASWHRNCVTQSLRRNAGLEQPNRLWKIRPDPQDQDRDEGNVGQ